jgi:hypothetical protein
MSVRSPLFYRKAKVGTLAVEDVSLSTGKRFYVHSTGTDGASYGTTPDAPFATIDYAIGKCTASKGDIIYVMEGHTETLAATIALDVAGVQIIGLGRGALRPKITGLTGIAMVTMTAANVTIRNIHLLAVAGVTYIVNGSAAAVAPIFEDVIFEQVAVPVKAVHFAGLLGGYGAEFTRCTFIARVNGPDYCVHFSSSAGDYWTMDKCVANYLVAGLDEAVVYSDHLQKGYLIKDCTFLGLDKYHVQVTSSVGAMCDGVMANTRIVCTGALASTVDLTDVANGLGHIDVLATDEKDKYGARIAAGMVSAQ